MKGKAKTLIIAIIFLYLLIACSRVTKNEEPTESSICTETKVEEAEKDSAETKSENEPEEDTNESEVEEILIGAPRDNNYSVTPMEHTEMVANTPLNVHTGPGAEYERYAVLNFHQEVVVTGVAENGWYQIEHNGTLGYVNSELVSNDPTKTIVPEVKGGEEEVIIPLPIPEPVIIPDCAHRWRNGNVLQYSTCTTSGLVQQRCILCGTTNVGALPKSKNHKFEVVEKGDCIYPEKHKCLYCDEWYLGKYEDHIDKDRDKHCDICCVPIK